MTKKDYRAIAGALHAAGITEAVEISGTIHPIHERAALEGARAQWGECVRYMADVLAADSPRFDRERFVRACETGEMGR